MVSSDVPKTCGGSGTCGQEASDDQRHDGLQQLCAEITRVECRNASNGDNCDEPADDVDLREPFPDSLEGIWIDPSLMCDE